MVTVVRTRQLAKHYGKVEAVRGLDLDVGSGEVYGLLGLNGAGKTTTVRMLTTLVPPTAGDAWIHDLSVRDDGAQIRTRIGALSEKNLVPEPRWSAARYLRYFGALHGMTQARVRDRTRQLFDVLALSSFAERPMGQLSGGNLRKVELARALLHEPHVLFLDEPTRELDIPSKRAMWAFLSELRRKGLTLFLSSHDIQEIGTLCTRIGILREGVLAWEGTSAELVRGGRSLVEALAVKLLGEDEGVVAPAPPTGPAVPARSGSVRFEVLR